MNDVQKDAEKSLKSLQKDAEKISKNPQEELEKATQPYYKSLPKLSMEQLSKESSKEMTKIFKKSAGVNPLKLYKIKKQILNNILDEYAQEDKISKSKARLSLLDKATIINLKKLYVYDLEKDKPVKLEDLSREYVQKMPELRGSEIANDPLETTSVLICDPNYLLYADLIKTKDGKWISIDDASNLGYKKKEVKELKSLLRTVSLAKDMSNPSKIDKNIDRITSLIEKINNEKEQLRY